MDSNSPIQPPRAFLKFFRWFCRQEFAEDLEGDLMERFDWRLENSGPKEAKRLFIKDVLHLLKPGLIKRIKTNQKLDNYGMFKNYFKVAYRNLWRHKGHSFINISGLAIGIMATLLMLVYVHYELGYDKQHSQVDQIYRVGLYGKLQNSEFRQTFTTAQLAPTLKQTFPEVKESVRMFKNGDVNFQLIEDSVTLKSYMESNIYAADASFFDIFSVRMIVGDGVDALSGPGKILLSESTAIRYFGEDWADQNIESKAITAFLGGGPVPISIAGVTEDMPDQSHFHFDFLISNENFPFSKATNWWNNSFSTYILLENGTSPTALEAKLSDVYEKNLPASAFENGNKWESFLQPLGDIHLKSTLNGEFEPNGNATYVYIFLITAILILVMACVNFINLTMAKASSRFKEMGVRKVIGSKRKQLIYQHLVESQLYCLISVLLATGAIFLVLPYFQSFTGIHLDVSYFNYPVIITILLLFPVLLGTTAGFYPAIYLTRLSPVRALKGTVTQTGKKASFQNVLVIVQFVISIGIIAGSFIISDQLNYIQNKQLGFQKDGILVLKNMRFLKRGIEQFKDDLEKNPQIIATTASSSVPTNSFSNVQFRPQDHGNISMDLLFADEEFLEAYNIKIAEGRFFQKELTTDASAIIINQSMAKNMDWDEPLGKEILLFGDQNRAFKVIGVIEDFHHQSLHHAMTSFVIMPSFSPQSFGTGYTSIRLSGLELQNTLAYIQKTWDDHAGGAPMNSFFMDDNYDALYKGELQTKSLFSVFSALTGVIAILGLLGLVSHVTQKRKKEISIRKVLGASIAQLIGMLVKNFLLLIGIALIVMTPIVWVLMNNWLENFSYSIDLPWTAFAIAGALAIAVSFITIGVQSLKAVSMNPTTNLRNE